MSPSAIKAIKQEEEKKKLLIKNEEAIEIVESSQPEQKQKKEEEEIVEKVIEEEEEPEEKEEKKKDEKEEKEIEKEVVEEDNSNVIDNKTSLHSHVRQMTNEISNEIAPSLEELKIKFKYEDVMRIWKEKNQKKDELEKIIPPETGLENICSSSDESVENICKDDVSKNNDINEIDKSIDSIESENTGINVTEEKKEVETPQTIEEVEV